MLNYITIGANDLDHSARFYAALLVPLGYAMTRHPDALEFIPPSPDRSTGMVYVTRPFDGRPATAGNGTMAAFRAPTQALVRALHAAGLAAGGSDEGAPGFRPQYSANFFVAYLRDPVGNKLALYCDDPAEGTRPA